MVEVTCAVDCRDRLGESPVWCPREKRLYWLDIKGRTISRFTPETGEHAVFPVDEQPGSLVLRERGGMIVAFYGGLSLLRARDRRHRDGSRGGGGNSREPHE